jgi:Ca2+-binding RTX toxin-like protein
VACNDDTQNVQSRVFFHAAAGQRYSIMVTSYGGTAGNQSLRLREAPTDQQLYASVDDFAWVNVISGRAIITGELACSLNADITLNWTLSQRHDGGTTQAFGDAVVACDGSTRWLDGASYGGGFRNGPAAIDLDATVPDDPAIPSAAVSKTLVVRTCTHIGTLGNDAITGRGSRDRICALAGNDVVEGALGNDTLRAFDGNDVGRGGRGNDLLTGGYGVDRLSGQRGTDTLFGDAGRDVLVGGGGKDVCDGGPGRDVFRGCETRRAS